MADLIPVKNRSLTPAQYGALADVPPEIEWLANITNLKTRRAYKNDVSEFSAFTGLRRPAELRTVTRAHVIAWRKDLEARLDPSKFVRLGRGTLANVELITKVTLMPGGLHVAILSNGQKLQVSRLQSRALRDRFLKL